MQDNKSRQPEPEHQRTRLPDLQSSRKQIYFRYSAQTAYSQRTFLVVRPRSTTQTTNLRPSPASYAFASRSCVQLRISLLLLATASSNSDTLLEHTRCRQAHDSLEGLRSDTTAMSVKPAACRGTRHESDPNKSAIMKPTPSRFARHTSIICSSRDRRRSSIYSHRSRCRGLLQHPRSGIW